MLITPGKVKRIVEDQLDAQRLFLEKMLNIKETRE
jgi:hypothetical protein